MLIQKKLLAFLLIFTAVSLSFAENALELFYFGSPHCAQCLEITHTLLNPLERELGERLKVHHFNTDDAESFELMMRLERQFGIEHGSPIELFFPDTFLLGFYEIMANTRSFVEERLNDPNSKRTLVIEEPAGDINQALRDRFSRFTLWAIIIAALIDSVNPCAIASLIFLLSFLSTQKRPRGEVLRIGLLFTFTVFITYLMFGIGAFKAISFLSGHLWVKEFIKWSAVACALVVGVLSLVDAIRYKISGNTKKVMLQLPKGIKLLVHKVITKNLSGKRLYLGTIIAGFIVTILDSICTAEVYLPVIVLMSQSTDGELRLQGWLYLILYNIIFVMPLLIVIIAAYFGMTWHTLAGMTQKNLALLKVLLGIIMLGLAAFLAIM